MNNPIVVFDQIQLRVNGWIVLEFVLADLKEHLHHVLNSLVNIGLMKDVSEAIKNGMEGSGGSFLEILSGFSSHADSQFNRVGRGALEKQGKDLEGQNLMNNLLIHKMRQ